MVGNASPIAPVSGGKAIFLIILCALFLLSSGCIFNDDMLNREEIEIGELGYDILNPANHPKMWIEIDWMMGVEPEFSKTDAHEPLDVIRDTLLKYSNSKRNYIESLKADDTLALPQERTTHTLGDIKGYEDLYRTFEITDEVISIYIIYLDGSYGGDDNGEKTLGLVFSPSSIAIFKKEIEKIPMEKLEPLQIDHRDVERAVLMHELGRLLGLEETDNTDCVMHSSIDSTRFIEEITGEYPKEFCQSSEEDLRDILMGLEDSSVDKVERDSGEKMLLKASFVDNCDMRNKECNVSVEYGWTEDMEEQPVEMKYDDNSFKADLGPYTSGYTLYYRIRTTDARGNLYESTMRYIETNEILLKDEGAGDTPGFGILELFTVLMSVLLVLGLLYGWSGKLPKR